MNKIYVSIVVLSFPFNKLPVGAKAPPVLSKKILRKTNLKAFEGPLAYI